MCACRYSLNIIVEGPCPEIKTSFRDTSRLKAITIKDDISLLDFVGRIITIMQTTCSKIIRICVLCLNF